MYNYAVNLLYIKRTAGDGTTSSGGKGQTSSTSDIELAQFKPNNFEWSSSSSTTDSTTSSKREETE
jgi:hypothetical protein